MSIISFALCRFHPPSNGNSISKSHPENEGYAHHYFITVEDLGHDVYAYDTDINIYTAFP